MNVVYRKKNVARPATNGEIISALHTLKCNIEAVQQILFQEKVREARSESVPTGRNRKHGLLAKTATFFNQNPGPYRVVDLVPVFEGYAYGSVHTAVRTLFHEGILDRFSKGVYGIPVKKRGKQRRF